jgi:hypothetical protein
LEDRTIGRAGRVLDALPASNFEFHTHHYDEELTTKPKNQKTYGRISGTIFFRAVRALKTPERQRVAKEKNEKK